MPSHPKKQLEREAARYRQRVAKGMCTKCGFWPAAPNRRMCSGCLAANTARATARYREMQRLTFDAYGWQCECCGEDEPLFLTIDHIEGGGRAQRRFRLREGGKDLYTWLAARGFPAGFRTLCFNCNCGRNRNGGVCPHKKESASK